MLSRCMIIAILSVLPLTLCAAPTSDDETPSPAVKISTDAWLDSILGLTTRDLRSDKDRDMFWATRGKRMLDQDDFWAIRGKKAYLENYLQQKRGLKPNGLFSSIKRAEEFFKRPSLKPNGLFGSFKRNIKPNGLFSTFKRGYHDDEDYDFLFGLGNGQDKRDDFWAARGKRGGGEDSNFWATRG